MSEEPWGYFVSCSSLPVKNLKSLETVIYMNYTAASKQLPSKKGWWPETDSQSLIEMLCKINNSNHNNAECLSIYIRLGETYIL